MDVHSGQMVQTVRRKTRRAFHTAGLSTANAILKIGKMAKQPFTLADTAFQSYAKQKNASRGNTGIPASDQDETESTLSSVDDPTESEQLIFGTLPQFFRSKTFNAELYELERVVPSKETDEKMAAQEEEAYCDQILAERKEQLQVVDKMLERKISKNYAAIVEGILQISRVNNGLQSVILSCERSRSLLHSVKTSYVKRSMSVAQLFRRQEHLKQVQDLLVRLNFIVEQDHVYQQLLKQRKFVEAVQLCDQIQFDEQIRSLSAITPLVSTWMTRKRDSSGVLTKIEETLVQCCYRIQEESFENCVNALYSLGEAHTAAIRITRAVKKVMEKCAVQVLVTFTSNMESKGIELAMRSVTPDEIRRCVAAVLTEMSKFFCNYQQLIHWFDRHLSIPASTMSPPVVLNLASTTHNTSHGATLETDHSQYVTQYIDYLREIRRVLVKERRTSCLHAIGNVIEMLQGTTSVTTKPIDMLWCTTAVQAFIRMCAVLENDMSSLSSVKNIARNFVRNNLHRPYMDSLISVMQNDTFHPMAGLQLEHLQLWRPLKRVGLETMYNLAVTYIQQRNADLDPEVFSVDYNYSALESSLGREPVSATHSDAIFVLSSHEVCRKMTKYIEEIVDPCPFLTNDTIDMLEEHIASYFYFVFSNMTHVTQSDRHSTYLVEEDGEIPQEQRILLGELKESTVRACSEAVTRHVPLNSQLILRMRSPKDIFAAPERTAALHSLSTVVDHLEKTCTTLEEFLSASQIKAHKALIARLRKCIAVMFRECTRRLAAALIPVHHCFHAIEKVKWNEIKSVGMFTEPSMYVKGIIDTVRAVFDRFKIYHKDFPDSASKDLLLRFVVLHIFSNLIEFYSRIKKCGEQGRSVMKFDVESISNQLKSLLGVAIVPNSHCVTNYIDGFGLSAEELFAWVQDWHHLYSTTQLLALVSYGHGVEGRTRDRQTVLAMLRELLVSLNHVDKTIFDVLA